MKLFYFVSIISFLCLPVHSQSFNRYTISGYVKEAVSGESLIGVNIYLTDSKSGTNTNNFGFYSLTLPETDSLELIVSYVGYKTEIIKIALHRNTELNVKLSPGVLLNEVLVSSDQNEKQSN